MPMSGSAIGAPGISPSSEGRSTLLSIMRSAARLLRVATSVVPGEIGAPQNTHWATPGWLLWRHEGHMTPTAGMIAVGPMEAVDSDEVLIRTPLPDDAAGFTSGAASSPGASPSSAL